MYFYRYIHLPFTLDTSSSKNISCGCKWGGCMCGWIKVFMCVVVACVFGSKYSCVVSNGTAALHLTGLALGWKKGDIVLTSALTFLASANSVCCFDAVTAWIYNQHLEFGRTINSMVDSPLGTLACLVKISCFDFFEVVHLILRATKFLDQTFYHLLCIL